MDAASDIEQEGQKLTDAIELVRERSSRLGDLLSKFEAPPGGPDREIYMEVARQCWKMASEMLPFAILAQVAILLANPDKKQHKKEAPVELPQRSDNPPVH